MAQRGVPPCPVALEGLRGGREASPQCPMTAWGLGTSLSKFLNVQFSIMKEGRHLSTHHREG